LPARRTSTLLPVLLVAALAALAALLPAAAHAGYEPVGAGEGTGEFGTVTGTVPLRGMRVVLMEAVPGAKAPIRLGSVRSGRGGRFSLHYRGAEAPTVKYLLARTPGGRYQLAAALGEGAVPRPVRVKVDDRTTVAMAYSMAQFIGTDDKVTGTDPGLRNAAAMSADLVDLHGGLSKVLRRFPNGASTSTLRTFDSLANLLALWRHGDSPECLKLLIFAGGSGDEPIPRDTLAAAMEIARNPSRRIARTFRMSLAAPHLYRPALGAREAPDAWTLALRFEGNPRSLDGPGNFAIDAEGNLWVGNNYAYSRKSRQPACGSEELARFTPTGQTYPGSPYKGGGLSGVGFGVTVDPEGRVWVGNFGFEGKGCEVEADHFTASLFSSSGRAISPSTGWEVGGISWPQGTISDPKGNVWVANCGNDSVTKILGATAPSLPTGPPPRALNFGEEAITAGSRTAFERPFADALDSQGNVYVTANASNSVAELAPEGSVRDLFSGGGLHLPMGVVADGNGYVWVSNSKWVVAPCPGVRTAKEVSEQEPQGGGDVTLIKPGGKVVPTPIKGGVVNPWGITVDGDDNVWVANFSGQRLTELCGSEPRNCPPGKRRTGAAISPEKTGYGFDGLVRNTGVIVDPSGNVWLANNWKRAALQTNPGGYMIVAYLGLAAPVRSPQIGPPTAP
jgi:hypothetical protein